jgi:hypothetical protein
MVTPIAVVVISLVVVVAVRAGAVSPTIQTQVAGFGLAGAALLVHSGPILGV